MHYLYLVATPKNEGTPKQEELSDLVSTTLTDEGFSGEGGFWNRSKSDWFVIGGRWSGHLQEIQLDNWGDKATSLIKSKKTDKSDFISSADTDNNKDELQALWESLGGVGMNSWNRNSYGERGGEDDTMLLDKKLYKALNTEKFKEVEVAIMTCEDEHIYTEDEVPLLEFLKDKKVVDNYYLTVVDYHN